VNYRARIVPILGALALLGACSKAPSEHADKGPVILKVNDKTYYAADLEREVAQEGRRGPEIQRLLATKEGQQQLLDRMVRRAVLLQEAERRKIPEIPEVVEQLATYRRDLLVSALLQKEIGEGVTVEDREVQEYFAAHPDEFSGDELRTRHILAGSDAEAQQALARLGKGESFEAVARALSRDSGSALKGGDLGYRKREQMFPAYAQAAFGLKPGQVSEPIKTPFGIEIIQLVDRKKGQAWTLEQVKEPLRRRLQEQRQMQHLEAWIKDLQGAAKITRDESALPVGKPAGPPQAVPQGPRS